jgi:hypothetical protein
VLVVVPDVDPKHLFQMISRQSEASSVPRLKLAPEGVDAGVPLVRDLLEGLAR